MMNFRTIFCTHRKLLKNSWLITCHKLIRRGLSSSRSNQYERPLILGIESSCDDSGAAIVDGKGNIVGEALASQMFQHLAFGGIIPPVAADMHRANIEPVVNSTMEKSGLNISDLDAIAVTNRPGLQLSLLVGVRYAKHLARKFNKPIIPIHHMEAHSLTKRMEENIPFPFLCLLVSGGHCLLSICKDVDKFVLLGESIDDAPGEAFDKISRRLKLRNLPEFRNLSGGEAIELAASRADKSKEYQFPLPLAKQRDCQFSFSGLKNTANRYIHREEVDNDIPSDGIMPGYQNFSLSFLKGVVRHICHRTQRAIEFTERIKLFDESSTKSLVVSGGVACNDFLFEAINQLGQQFDYKVVRPRRKLCTDNGVMIAWNGVEKFKQGIDVTTDYQSIRPYGKCQLGESWIEKVKEANITCKWAKIPILRDVT
uniref:N(6)-L-threonylcarbamoyladenine synthase n=1 Tax=Culicoides sonorensis TaxID=179676 RepID=A0A336MN16_CULSO